MASKVCRIQDWGNAGKIGSSADVKYLLLLTEEAYAWSLAQ